MAKVLIATGGTGGHIYPGLFTAREMGRRGFEVRFIGVLSTVQEKLCAEGFSCEVIHVRGFVSKSPLEVIGAAFLLIRAFFQCARVVAAYRPDVVIGFGGYSSFPTVMVARMFGRRAMIQEQNAVPGLANRILAQCVPVVCVGFRDSLRFFPRAKAVWTGTPHRPLNTSIERTAAARHFGLDPARPTVLVFGGSQGARRINACFFEMFSSLPEGRRFQVIHATGKKDIAEYERRYAALGAPSCVRAFIDNIDEAYAVADMVVARSGAGTVTELGVLGMPAVLIPYPGAKDHQLMNAKVLEKAGAAEIIEEKSLSSQLLGDKIFSVLERKSSRRDLQEKMRNEFPADPVRRLVDEAERLVQA